MQQDKAGRAELRTALRAFRPLFLQTIAFSMFVNLLMLTGPIFMLQVYDRVLASRSMETLIALTLLVAALFLAMGLLEFARGRVLARIGLQFHYLLDIRVFEASLKLLLTPEGRGRTTNGLRDLNAVQGMLTGPAPLAVFDAPWTPVYLAVVFMLHPVLGWFAVGSIVVLLLLSVVNEYLSRGSQDAFVAAQAEADAVERSVWREAESVKALGMSGALAQRWRMLATRGLSAQVKASDRSGAVAALSRGLRFFLQSAILAVGAALVIRQEISAGVMIVASILMGRALAPVDTMISQWGAVQRAGQGWRALAELLSNEPATPPAHALPAPTGHVVAKDLSIAPPGWTVPVVRDLNFEIAPGEAVGVIGPSGCGKSTLAKVLAGVWTPVGGELRLDGATLDQWDSDSLGRRIGYLPQDVGLIGGTVAENISRFAPEPDSAAVNAAGKLAEAHDTIMKLPAGYDTPVGVGGAQLSGGQRQRIALSRALYGEPVLLILDEPNAHLDAAGEAALIGALQKFKARGGAVAIIAHRASILSACEKVLIIQDGVQTGFGPRDELLVRRPARPTLVKPPQTGAEDAEEPDPAPRSAGGPEGRRP